MLRQHTVAICCLLAATVLRNASFLFALQRENSISIGGTDMHVPAISVFTRLSFGMFKDTPLLEARQECVEL